MFRLMLIISFLILGLAQAQGLDLGIFSEGAIAWLTATGALVVFGTQITRRGTAFILERSWASWLKGDRAILLSLCIAAGFTLAIFQAGVLKDASALALMPKWVTALFVFFGSFISASGGYDSDAQKQRASFKRDLALSTNNMLISNALENSNDVYKSPIGILVASLARGLVPAEMLPFALTLLKPLATHYLGTELTQSAQVMITAEVHRMLKSAGLIKTKSVKGLVSLVSIVFLVALLSACDFIPQVTSNLGNPITADGASLTYTASGLSFDPGLQSAVSVVIDIQGSDIKTESAFCKSLEFSVSCFREDVSSVWELEFTCLECSAFATFFRPDSAIPHSVLPD